jgi:hypothetical protein
MANFGLERKEIWPQNVRTYRYIYIYIHIYTGLFISSSGISDRCGTVTGMVTPKGNMSTEGETLQVSVLPCKCSICPLLVTRQMSNLAIFANSKTQNGFCIPCPRHVSSRLPPSDKTCKYAAAPSAQKETWRDSLLIYMLLSAVSVLVVAQRSSEVSEGLMNNPVYVCIYIYIYIYIPFSLPISAGK